MPVALNSADSPAIRSSAASERHIPPPYAAPLIAASTGCGMRRSVEDEPRVVPHRPLRDAADLQPVDVRDDAVVLQVEARSRTPRPAPVSTTTYVSLSSRDRAQRVVELDHELDRHRVQPFGPVERDDARVRLRLVDEHQVGHAGHASPSPLAGANSAADWPARAGAVRRATGDATICGMPRRALPVLLAVLISVGALGALACARGRRIRRRRVERGLGRRPGAASGASSTTTSSTSTTTTTAPIPSSAGTLTLTRTVTGDISPKSVVASERGLVFAQNMMYRHTITVYDRNGDLVKTIPDTVNLAALRHPRLPDAGAGRARRGRVHPRRQARVRLELLDVRRGLRPRG